jgi:protease-4
MMNETPPPSQWERQVLEKLASSALDEQRRARRWGIFFKLLAFAYLFLLLFLFKAEMLEFGETASGEKHTALVEIQGVIAADSEARADHVIGGLRKAFEDKHTAGVILRINSPGGSPVQAGYINDEIRRLREKYKDIPVYAVITDLCASGGYYIAAAADKIYVDKASIVGSIGVIMNGFGFVETMEKLGVERRLLIAGEHKALFDPFSPEKPEESAHLQAMLNQIHQQFIDTVKQGRGERLKDDPKLFSGLVWSGEEAIALGLADELGSSSYVAREVIKAETIVDFTPKKDYLERFAKRFGAAMAENLVHVLNLDAAKLR